MDENVVIERLISESDFSRLYAEVFVRAKGRCEYCGRDLLMDRLGYAVAEADHIFPLSSKHEINDQILNLALACRTCNGVKRDFVLQLDNEKPEEALSRNRTEILKLIRVEIAKRMEPHDVKWRNVTEILQGVWWS